MFEYGDIEVCLAKEVTDTRPSNVDLVLWEQIAARLESFTAGDLVLIGYARGTGQISFWIHTYEYTQDPMIELVQAVAKVLIEEFGIEEEQFNIRWKAYGREIEKLNLVMFA